MSEKTYKIVLSPVTQVALPGAGSLYLLLAYLFDFPHENLVLLTCLILQTVIGIIKSNRHPKYDGKIIVTKSEGKKVFTLELDGNPDEIENKQSISFKVVPQDGDIVD